MSTTRVFSSLVGGVLLLIASARPTGAQQLPLKPGARVRVRTAAPRRQTLVGTVIGWEQTTLSVNVATPDRPAGTRVEVALQDVTDLQVSRGRKPRTGRGALIGAGVGLAAGVIAGAIVGGQWPDIPEPGWLVGAAYLGGIGLVAGAGTGALIGTMRRGESWQDVSLDSLRVSIVPDMKWGAPVGLAVRFDLAF